MSPGISETRRHTLPDGRVLAWCEFGKPDGHPVFYAHGGPGSRFEGAIFHEKASEHGFRVIATDRPGMGQSTFLPNRKLLDYPADVARLADALGIERFGVMGWSGGGAHTTVCGYAIPDRLTFNLSFAGYTNWAELPGAVDMLEFFADRIAIRLSKRSPRAFEGFFSLFGWYVRRFPKSYVRTLRKGFSGTDRKEIDSERLQQMFLVDQVEAFVQGGRGVATDALVHYVDWGFRLKDIPATLHVFHGTEDKNVPLAYGRHIAGNAPNCELHVLEGRGHLFPASHQDLIFEVARRELEETGA